MKYGEVKLRDTGVLQLYSVYILATSSRFYLTAIKVFIDEKFTDQTK